MSVISPTKSTNTNNIAYILLLLLFFLVRVVVPVVSAFLVTFSRETMEQKRT